MASGFDEVYWQVVSGVDAPRDQLVAMLPELRSIYSAGNAIYMADVVACHLPDGTWHWPAYAEQVADRDERARRAEIRELRNYDLSDFLTGMRIAALRALYKNYAAHTAASPGKGKAEIIPAIFALLSIEQQEALRVRLRDEALAEFNEPAPPDYREMRVSLCRRISTILYAQDRYDQLGDIDLVALRPRWRFHWGEGGERECRKFNGKALPIADARRVFPQLPCACLECTCYLSAEK